ncbi:MAG: LysR substrate-binding domain-containing protein, partial [Paracoccaceae bacterium]
QLGTLAIGDYAAQNYLAKRREPRCIEDLRSHHMIGFDRDETILRAMRSFGWPAERSWFSVRSDDHALCWSMMRPGCGIGFFLRAVGDKEATVRRLLPDLDIAPLNLWLAAHEKLIKTPSVRAIWDHLEARLKPLVDLA